MSALKFRNIKNRRNFGVQFIEFIFVLWVNESNVNLEKSKQVLYIHVIYEANYYLLNNYNNHFE